MSNKLDINKLLQKPSLLTPIDYSGIEIPNINKTHQVVQNFEDWRKSQGFKTNEEKLQEAQERASTAIAELGNSEDVYDWYNAHQPDPRKQAKFREDGAKTAGLLMTVPLTVASAGTMGWIPALTSTATGFAGAYGGQKLGEAIDAKYDTNTTPWLALAGGFAGGIGGYKGLVKAGSAGLLKGSGQMYGKQFIGDVAADVFNKGIKQGNPYLSTYLWKDFLTQEMTDPDRAVHVSHSPIAGKTTSTKAAHSSGTKWVPGSAERSLVGDDNMIWLWEGKPYRNQWNDQTFISVPKSNSMIQTRQARATGVPEINLTDPSTKILTKNPITNGFERQIVVETPVQSAKGSYAWFERPSKLTEAERLGIPKGERNQPYKYGHRKEFPNDKIVNAEPLKKEMIDLFNSDVYRSRLIKAGYTPEQIDDFLKTRMQLNAVRKAPTSISNNVELGDAGYWYRNHVKIAPTTKDVDETIFHELGHGSDFPGVYRDPRQPRITKLAFPGSNYYLNPSEVRTRGLGVLQWMKKHGKTIDDFYTPGAKDLNRRAQEFLIYYPEDQGRQYLSTFWKQGGKINPQQ